uniref:Beta-defensin n=1 Tax=Equus asinus TaxID=9793 RepID=A0A9L0KI75_EQUAS
VCGFQLSMILTLMSSAEKCWNLHGTCRGKCGKNEKFFLFCKSGKPCCLKLNFQPNLPLKSLSA